MGTAEKETAEYHTLSLNNAGLCYLKIYQLLASEFNSLASNYCQALFF